MSKPELKRDESALSEPHEGLAEETKVPSVPVAETEDNRSIGKIRDILFGPQSRDFEQRLTRLEERLTRETAERQDEIKRRFDSLENYTKAEVESLSQRINAEQAERAEALKEISRLQQEIRSALEQRIGQVEEQAGRGQQDLRQLMLEESKNLNGEIRQKTESVSAALAHEVEQLRRAKTDRAALADLFTELAKRVGNES
jgi:hypothetical protein